MFWEKYALLCANEGMSPNAVAKEMGVSSGTITGWKKGNAPSNESIKKVADRFGVSVTYLRDSEDASEGGGEDYDVEAEARKLAAKLGMIARRSEADRTKVLARKKPAKFVIQMNNPVFVPVYESVSAGFGILARNEVIEHIPCILPPAEAKEYIGIKVQGDSMYPKIEDGDTVIVHKQTSVDSGTLAVVLVDGEEGYVKRVEYGPDWINLVSINPMYPPMRFKGEEVTRVSVQGKVTKVIKDV